MRHKHLLTTDPFAVLRRMCHNPFVMHTESGKRLAKLERKQRRGGGGRATPEGGGALLGCADSLCCTLTAPAA